MTSWIDVGWAKGPLNSKGNSQLGMCMNAGPFSLQIISFVVTVSQDMKVIVIDGLGAPTHMHKQNTPVKLTVAILHRLIV